MVSGLLTKTETVTLDFAGGPATAARSPFPVIPVAAGLAVLVLLAAAAGSSPGPGGLGGSGPARAVRGLGEVTFGFDLRGCGFL